MKDFIPRQELLETNPVHLISMNQYVHELSTVAHRHDHYMIMWITKGHGTQMIDGQEHQMLTNRVFFFHPGQVHKMNDFERDGWMLIFDEPIYKLFTRFHPQEELNGMMQQGGHEPFVDLDEDTAVLYEHITAMIQKELLKSPKNFNMLIHFVSLLLLAGNKLHEQKHTLELKNKNSSKQLIRNLTLLIEQHFKKAKPVSFYADALNLQSRNLNRIVKTKLGYTVHDLLQERLLTESKILLASSPLTIKEISYSLGFTDPSYFNRFFKKNTHVTPAAFRAKGV